MSYWQALLIAGMLGAVVVGGVASILLLVEWYQKRPGIVVSIVGAFLVFLIGSLIWVAAETSARDKRCTPSNARPRTVTTFYDPASGC